MRSIDQLDLDSKKYIIFDMDGTLIDSVGVWNATDKKLVEEFSDNTISLEAAQFERDTFLHNASQESVGANTLSEMAATN